MNEVDDKEQDDSGTIVYEFDSHWVTYFWLLGLSLVTDYIVKVIS